jgi:hypothetical protein
MISFGCHVCAIADFSVSPIQSCALNAGIRMDTKGFIIVIPYRFLVATGSTPISRTVE